MNETTFTNCIIDRGPPAEPELSRKKYRQALAKGYGLGRDAARKAMMGERVWAEFGKFTAFLLLCALCVPLFFWGKSLIGEKPKHTEPETQSWVITIPSGAVRGFAFTEDGSVVLPPYDTVQQVAARARGEGFRSGFEHAMATLRMIKRNEAKLGRELTQDEIDAITATELDESGELITRREAH